MLGYVYSHVPVLIICLAIVLLVSGVSIWWQRKIGKAKSELRAIRKKVIDFRESGGVKMISDLERFSEILQSVKFLRIAWSEYEETIVKEFDTDDEGGGRVFNTIGFDKFASFDETLGREVHKDMIVRVPAIVTSAGLAFTFIFICVGLDSLKVDTSGSAPVVTGIKDLIDNLSAKFLT